MNKAKKAPQDMLQGFLLYIVYYYFLFSIFLSIPFSAR